MSIFLLRHGVIRSRKRLPLITAEVVLSPGDDIQAAIDVAAEGTTFILQAGTYREQSLVPKSGQSFVGEAGAILSGARVISSWTADSGLWKAEGLPANDTTHGSCDSGSPRCNYPQDLWIDGVRQTHVATVGEVTTGTWFFDYTTDTVWIGVDPSGKTVELSVTATAFSGSAAGVYIGNLTVEKYANAAQSGAIAGNNSVDWVVEDCTIRENHGVGLRIGDGMMVRNNLFLHNGQLGLGGIGDGVTVEGNEIAFNNAAGYNWGWEAGGTKFVRTRDLKVRNNYVHDNVGPGLWTDIENIDVLVEGNRVEDNAGPGIYHEISWTAIIRRNVVKRNGLGLANSYSGAAGILISSSGLPTSGAWSGYSERLGDDGRPVAVEVYENRVEDNGGGIVAIQQNRGAGDYGDYRVTGLWVHDNITRITSGFTAVGRDDGIDTIWDFEAHNRYDRNVYRTTGNRFHWGGTSLNFSGWQAAGNDTNGSLVDIANPSVVASAVSSNLGAVTTASFTVAVHPGADLLAVQIHRRKGTGTVAVVSATANGQALQLAADSGDPTSSNSERVSIHYLTDPMDYADENGEVEIAVELTDATVSGHAAIGTVQIAGIDRANPVRATGTRQFFGSSVELSAPLTTVAGDLVFSAFKRSGSQADDVAPTDGSSVIYHEVALFSATSGRVAAGTSEAVSWRIDDTNNRWTALAAVAWAAT